MVTKSIDKDSSFGEARIVKLVGRKNYREQYLCECSCGKTFVAYKDHLLSGRTSSCPACSRGYNLKGQTSQGWKAEFKEGRNVRGEAMWVCRCEVCGKEKKFSSSQFRSGKLPLCNHTGQDTSSDTDFFSYF